MEESLLKELTDLLHQDVMLLENSTPESTYKGGKATGEFEQQLRVEKDSVMHFPSLRYVKDAADSSGCFVQGFDLSEDVDELSMKENKIDGERVGKVYESIVNIASELLHSSHKKITDQEYHMVDALNEKMFDWHSNCVPLVGDDVNMGTIQAALGHSSLATTQIYAHVKNKALDKALSNQKSILNGAQ